MKRFVGVAVAVLAVVSVCLAQGQVGEPEGATNQTALTAWNAIYSAAHSADWAGVETKCKAFEQAHPGDSRVTDGYIAVSKANAIGRQGRDTEALWLAIYTNTEYLSAFRIAAAGTVANIKHGEGYMSGKAEWLRKAAEFPGIDVNRKAGYLNAVASTLMDVSEALNAINTMDVTTVRYDLAHYYIRNYLRLGGSASVAAAKAGEVLTGRLIDESNPWADVPTTRVSNEEPAVHSIEALYRYTTPLTLGHEAWSEFILKFRSCLLDLTDENEAFFVKVKKAAEMVD